MSSQNKVGSTGKTPRISATEELLTHIQNMQALRQKTVRDLVLEQLGEDVAVTDKDGKILYNLNSNLVLKQGISASDLRNLKLLHREKLEYFEKMRATDDPKQLKEFAHEVECIEFEMQKAWNFAQDRSFHEWYRVPKCTCPKMDNADSRGFDQRIINLDCPVHGS